MENYPLRSDLMDGVFSMLFTAPYPNHHTTTNNPGSETWLSISPKDYA